MYICEGAELILTSDFWAADGLHNGDKYEVVYLIEKLISSKKCNYS